MTREEITALRDKGYTFADIAREKGVSRQWVHSKYTMYYKAYTKTDRYKMYRRHMLSHFVGAKPYKPCQYCNSSRGLIIE